MEVGETFWFKDNKDKPVQARIFEIGSKFIRLREKCSRKSYIRLPEELYKNKEDVEEAMKHFKGLD